LPLASLSDALDGAALARLERLGLAQRLSGDGTDAVTLTPRGRLVGGAVTADLLA
jgi:hypothetical protein